LAEVVLVREWELGRRPTCVDWSPDGAFLVVGDLEGGIELATAEGRSLWRRSADADILKVRFSPDGRFLAVLTRLGQVLIWTVGGSLHLNSRPPTSLAPAWGIHWSTDSEEIAICTGLLTLLRIESGALIQPWSLPSGAICAAFPPGTSALPLRLAVVDTQKSIWLLPDGDSRVELLRLDCQEQIASLAFSDDGMLLAANGENHLHVWELAQREKKFTRSISTLATVFTSHGILTLDRDGTIWLLETVLGEEIARAKTGSLMARPNAAYSDDGNRLALSSDNGLQIWDIAGVFASARLKAIPEIPSTTLELFINRQTATVGRHARKRHRIPPPIPDTLTWGNNVDDTWSGTGAIALFSSEKTALLGFHRNPIRCINLFTKTELFRTISRDTRIWDLAIAPDQSIFAASFGDGAVGIFNSNSGEPINIFQGHSGEVNKSSFSPDGSLIASAFDNSTIKIWEPRTGSIKLTIEGHSGNVCAVDWHPEGEILASSSEDRSFRVWSVKSGEELFSASPHQSKAFSVAWSPDGTLLASASEEVFVLRLADKRLIAASQGAEHQIGCVAWSPDGRILATAENNPAIRLWNPLTGGEIHRFEFQGGSAWRLAWAASGAFLAASLSTGQVQIFDTRKFTDRHYLPQSAFLRRVPEFEPLLSSFCQLGRLGIAVPLSELQTLQEVFADGAVQPTNSAPFATHVTFRQLKALHWPASARIGLLSLLLSNIRREEQWTPPQGVTASQIREALAEALAGEPIPPQAPALPVAQLLQAADRLDNRVFTLLELLGADAVTADPGLPLRLLPQAQKLPVLGVVQREELSLRLRLEEGGRAHGQGVGGERTGIDLHGDLRALLPSQLGLPPSILRARFFRGDLLYRTREGKEPPRLRATVILLDVSPPTFGPIESITRLAAHIVACALLEANLPALLITVSGAPAVFTLERRVDLVNIWTQRDLKPAEENRSLLLARALSGNLAAEHRDPVVLVLSHVFFAADQEIPQVQGLRGLFVDYPGKRVRPAIADTCERWASAEAGQAGGLGEILGRLLG
jgi:WD40 repeat protein